METPIKLNKLAILLGKGVAKSFRDSNVILDYCGGNCNQDNSNSNSNDFENSNRKATENREYCGNYSAKRSGGQNSRHFEENSNQEGTQAVVSEYEPSQVYYDGRETAGCGFVVHGHIAYRYEMLRIIGEGPAVTVIYCFDHKANEFVSVKVIEKGRRGIAEVGLLRELGEDHLVRMNKYFSFQGKMCIVYAMLPINASSEHFERVAVPLIRKIAAQALRGVEDSQHIDIHCELEPGNLMCTSNEQTVKAVDFGINVPIDNGSYTDTQSKADRAPEAMVGSECSIVLAKRLITEMLLAIPAVWFKDKWEDRED